MLVRDEGSAGEIEVALPQSGEFDDLAKETLVHIGWSGEQANCFAAGAE